MKPYPSYIDSGVEWIGEIPIDWEKTKLKYISEIVTGNTPPKKDEENYEGGENLWVKPDELNGFYPTNETKEKLTEKGKNLSRVIPPYNVFVNGIGNIGRFGFSEMEVSTNQQINSIVFNEKCIPRYGLYLISSMGDEFQKQSEKVVVSILIKSRQENVETVIPPLFDQHQVITFLDSKTQKVDELIEKSEQKIELLKEKRTSLINHCVTKGLNPNVEMKDSEISWVGEIPKEWNKSKLKYIVPGINVGLVITPSIYYKDDGVIPMISGRNVKPYKIDLSIINKISIEDNEKLKTSKIYEGDIVTVRDGIPGDSSVVPPELNGINCSSCIIIRKSDLVLSRFLCHIINSYLGKHQIEQVSYGVGVGHFNIGHIRHFYLFIPPISEQTQIVAYLDKQTQKIDKLIEKETKRIELLKKYRQSLISEVVTGKIDVRDEVVV